MLPVSVTAPGNAAGPSACSSLNTAAARPGVRCWTLRHSFAMWTYTPCSLGTGNAHLAPSRHKDSPAISFLGLFPMALGPCKRPSKIPKPEILAEFPWSVLPLPRPLRPLPPSLSLCQFLASGESRGVECSPPKSGGLQGRPRPGCLVSDLIMVLVLTLNSRIFKELCNLITG